MRHRQRGQRFHASVDPASVLADRIDRRPRGIEISRCHLRLCNCHCCIRDMGTAFDLFQRTQSLIEGAGSEVGIDDGPKYDGALYGSFNVCGPPPCLLLLDFYDPRCGRGGPSDIPRCRQGHADLAHHDEPRIGASDVLLCGESRCDVARCRQCICNVAESERATVVVFIADHLGSAQGPVNIPGLDLVLNEAPQVGRVTLGAGWADSSVYLVSLAHDLCGLLQLTGRAQPFRNCGEHA